MIGARSIRIAAALAGGVLALLVVPRAAVADDALNLVGGASAAGFFQILEHVAEHAGFYAAEHLQVNEQYAGSAATCLQLVATGKGDVCASSIEPIIQGYEKGLRLQVFFNRDPQYDWVLGVLDDSPIKTLADFKGQDIGEITAGTAGEPAAESMLAGAGLRKGDYTFVPIGSAAQGLSAIVERKVAGVIFPTVELQMDEAFGHVTFRVFRHPILKDISTSCFVATAATIQTKGDVLRRFSRAMVKSAIFIRVNPQLAARYFLAGAGMKATPQALTDETRAIELSQGDLPAADLSVAKIGYTPLRGVEIYSKFLYDGGRTTQLVPPSAIVTNQFIDFANGFDRRAFIAQVRALR